MSEVVVKHTDNKRIAKNTLLLYGRMLFQMAIGIYTSRLVLEALGVDDFGIYNVVGGFVMLFNIISGSMTTATQRFISFEIGKGKEGDVHRLFSSAVMIHVTLALIVFIVGETVGVYFVNTQMNFPPDRYYAANWVFQLSLLTFMVNVFSVPYNAAIVAYERMSAFAYISIIEVLAKLGIVWVLFATSHDRLILYAILMAVVAIVIRIIYGIYTKRNFPLCKNDWKCYAEHRKRMLSFVSWNLIGSVAMNAKEQGINVLLNIFFGAAVNAARGVAYQLFGAINGFVNNFQMAMNPQIIKSFAASQRDDMFKLVFRGSKFSFFIMFCIGLPFLVEAPYVLKIWLKVVPEYSAIFLRIVLLMSLVTALSGTLITSMHASGKVRDYQIVVGGVSLLTLPLAWLLLRMGLPPYFAMLASLGVECVCYFLRMFMLKLSIGFPIRRYISAVTVRVFLVAVSSAILPIVAYELLPVNFWTFLVVGALSFVSAVAFSYLFGLDKAERQMVNGKVNTIVRKIRHK